MATVFNPERYRLWLYENSPDGEAVYTRRERIVAACALALDANHTPIDRQSVPLCLCHMDPNPANAIWGAGGGGGGAMVDGGATRASGEVLSYLVGCSRGR